MVSGHLDREKKINQFQQSNQMIFLEPLHWFSFNLLRLPVGFMGFFWIQQNKAQTSGCFF